MKPFGKLMTDPSLLAKLTAAAQPPSPNSVVSNTVGNTTIPVGGNVVHGINPSNMWAQQANAQQEFYMNGRAQVALEMLKIINSNPGLRVLTPSERAEAAVKEADALIRELQR